MQKTEKIKTLVPYNVTIQIIKKNIPNSVIHVHIHVHMRLSKKTY